MRRVRIPGWTSTTPAPRVSRNRNRNGAGKEVADGGGPENAIDINSDDIPGKGGNDDSDLSGKQLLDNLRNTGTGSCPYYFFYNTK